MFRSKILSKTWYGAVVMASALFVPFVLGVGAGTRDDGGASGGCPVEQKVTGLLASWEAALKDASGVSPAAREQLATRFAALKAECPVGSRLDVTLAAVRDVLGAVIAADEANAKRCPIASASATGDGKSAACAEACEAAKTLMTARSKALRGLHQLASHAARFVSAPGCQAPVTAEAAVAAPAASGDCCASACPVRLASRVGALKASWETAGREAAALSPETRQRLVAGRDSLAQDSRAISNAVSLVPATVLALTEGFEALGAIHGKMAEWRNANPEVIKSIPEELRLSFALQQALIDETGGLLLRVRETMKTMDPGCVQGKEKVETARS
jgi:hypothetical protein